MRANKLTAIIVGISSDIGLSLAKHWHAQGVDVIGTYRTSSTALKNSIGIFKKILYCDFLDKNSINKLSEDLEILGFKWDILVICPGTMNPIGAFSECDIDEWESGLSVNLMSPLRVFHGLMHLRRGSRANPSLVIFFAGGGVNGAPVNFSCYTTSKIALIKATELLDAEFGDIKFSIIGPGWVKTKIHQETLESKLKAIECAAETARRIASNDFNSVEQVLKCIEWILKSPKRVVGGRNFSVVYDEWGSAHLDMALQHDQNKYKLRRSGNS